LAKNRLDSDFINQRLGGGSRSPVQRRAAAISAADDNQGGITPGFLAAVLALCAAVGGGTFYLAGSGGTLTDIMNGTTGSFTSAVDGACKKMWVANGRNTPALNCYLTTNVARLCNPREKKHLAQVIRSYRNDVIAFNSQMMLGGFKAVAIARSSESMENMKIMSQSVAKQQNNQNYEMSAAETQAFADHAKMVGKMEEVARTPAIMNSLGTEQISEKEIAKKIRRLAASGYVSKGDFGWFPDDLVAAAFNNIKVTGSPCKS
jgi:hypothetical protein